MIKNELHVSPIIEMFENQAPRGLALDLGCGSGDNAVFLAQKGFSVTAVDLNKNAIERLQEKIECAKNISIEIQNEDIRDFTIEINKYSIISALNSLNFMSKSEFLEILEKIKKGISVNGLCIITLFTNKDPMCEKLKAKTNFSDEGFMSENGKKWYFPKENELKDYFEKDFEILFYVETVVEDRKGHPGDENPHKHHITRMVAKKRSD